MLAAVTEVIRAQGGKETETEYFAALVSQFSDHYLLIRLFRSCIISHCFPLLTQCASVSGHFGQTFNLKTSLGDFFGFQMTTLEVVESTESQAAVAYLLNLVLKRLDF